MIMPTVSSGDQNAVPIESMFHGFGQFSGYMLSIGGESLPSKFNLYPNYPNPFNPTTKITYDLVNASDVKLEIYDLMGRKINTLVDQIQNAGHYSIIWNANDQAGNQVSAGVYLFRLQADKQTLTRKMILMK
tara:strand:- start:136 stop:531 length:396 start_codon:yes stop_codon:yes gene_type:complete